MDQPAIKLLIVTDLPESLTQIGQMLVKEEDVGLVGSAMSGDQALDLVKVHQPDVVVMDYDMPGLDGAETTRAILHEDASVQVIMLSVVNEADDIRRAMRAGARDYLVKPLKKGELVRTVRWLINERREYARIQAFIDRLRQAYEALFTDDKQVPPKVVAYLEAQVAEAPGDRLQLETLAVAYARNRNWGKLAPLAALLAETQEEDEPDE
jgi:DNA-binding NarL/FixJ family response regulator